MDISKVFNQRFQHTKKAVIHMTACHTIQHTVMLLFTSVNALACCYEGSINGELLPWQFAINAAFNSFQDDGKSISYL